MIIRHHIRDIGHGIKCDIIYAYKILAFVSFIHTQRENFFITLYSRVFICDHFTVEPISLLLPCSLTFMDAQVI